MKTFCKKEEWAESRSCYSGMLGAGWGSCATGSDGSRVCKPSGHGWTVERRTMNFRETLRLSIFLAAREENSRCVSPEMLEGVQKRLGGRTKASGNAYRNVWERVQKRKAIIYYFTHTKARRARSFLCPTKREV